MRRSSRSFAFRCVFPPLLISTPTLPILIPPPPLPPPPDEELEEAHHLVGIIRDEYDEEGNALRAELTSLLTFLCGQIFSRKIMRSALCQRGASLTAPSLHQALASFAITCHNGNRRGNHADWLREVAGTKILEGCGTQS